MLELEWAVEALRALRSLRHLRDVRATEAMAALRALLRWAERSAEGPTANTSTNG